MLGRGGYAVGVAVGLACAAAGLLAGPDPLAADENSDLQKMQGTWECVETHFKGKRVDKYVGVRAIMKGNNLTWLFPKDGKFSEVKATFRIDPAKDPKHFDWTAAGTTEVHTRLYKFEGDALVWSTNLGTKAPRPARFSDGDWQFTMKRLK